jgi:PGF-pre-PGF domain-containing protein
LSDVTSFNGSFESVSGFSNSSLTGSIDTPFAGSFNVTDSCGASSSTRDVNISSDFSEEAAQGFDHGLDSQRINYSVNLSNYGSDSINYSLSLASEVKNGSVQNDSSEMVESVNEVDLITESFEDYSIGAEDILIGEGYGSSADVMVDNSAGVSFQGVNTSSVFNKYKQRVVRERQFEGFEDVKFPETELLTLQGSAPQTEVASSRSLEGSKSLRVNGSQGFFALSDELEFSDSADTVRAENSFYLKENSQGDLPQTGLNVGPQPLTDTGSLPGLTILLGQSDGIVAAVSQIDGSTVQQDVLSKSNVTGGWLTVEAVFDREAKNVSYSLFNSSSEEVLLSNETTYNDTSLDGSEFYLNALGGSGGNYSMYFDKVSTGQETVDSSVEQEFEGYEDVKYPDLKLTSNGLVSSSFSEAESLEGDKSLRFNGSQGLFVLSDGLEFSDSADSVEAETSILLEEGATDPGAIFGMNVGPDVLSFTGGTSGFSLVALINQQDDIVFEGDTGSLGNQPTGKSFNLSDLTGHWLRLNSVFDRDAENVSYSVVNVSSGDVLLSNETSYSGSSLVGSDFYLNALGGSNGGDYSMYFDKVSTGQEISERRNFCGRGNVSELSVSAGESVSRSVGFDCSAVEMGLTSLSQDDGLYNYSLNGLEVLSNDTRQKDLVWEIDKSNLDNFGQREGVRAYLDGDSTGVEVDVRDSVVQVVFTTDCCSSSPSAGRYNASLVYGSGVEPQEDDDDQQEKEDDPVSSGGGGGVIEGDFSEPNEFNVSANGTVVNSLEDRNISVDSVALTSNESDDYFRIEVESLEDKPDDTEDLSDRVYSYLSIDVVGLLDEKITEGVVEFSVSKDWMTSNGIDVSTVELRRYNQGWDSLDTSETSETDDTYEFEAEVPGYSYFAIAAERDGTTDAGSNVEDGTDSVPQNRTEGSVNQSEKDSSSSDGGSSFVLPLVAVLVLVGVGAAVIVMRDDIVDWFE